MFTMMSINCLQIILFLFLFIFGFQYFPIYVNKEKRYTYPPSNYHSIVKIAINYQKMLMPPNDKISLQFFSFFNLKIIKNKK